jgi:hypothetical protein
MHHNQVLKDVPTKGHLEQLEKVGDEAALGVVEENMDHNDRVIVAKEQPETGQNAEQQPETSQNAEQQS